MYSSKDKIIQATREIYAKKYYDCKPAQGCVYWAAAFQEAARMFGRDDVLIQAGSANFQFQADDGVSPTHFSYEFDPVEATCRISRGLLPEIHCWNALRDTQEIVDVTLRYQPEQARLMLGYEWQKEFALPDYFWGRPDSRRIMYRADATATLYALGLMACWKNVVDSISGCAKVKRGDKKI